MTSYSLKPHQIELSFSDTISNDVQSQQESTTTFESELMPKEKLETIGLKSIKKCVHCKRWDDASTMYYHKVGGNYYHRKCNTIQLKNGRTCKKYLSDSAPKRFFHPVIGKCRHCKGYDLKDNFNLTTKRMHKQCNSTAFKNCGKMKAHKTNTCAFTGLPFGDKSEMKPVGDHDHDTLLYRGHIWSAANRLEGAAKFIMNEAGWTVDELCDALKNYLAKPGIDIGLEPYPVLGYATPEEALHHLNNGN